MKLPLSTLGASTAALFLLAASLVGQPTVSVSPTTVASGDTVTVTWTGITVPHPNDWVGLYPVGTPDIQFGHWLYTGGASSGSIPFLIAASWQRGSYEMRLFSGEGNGFTRLAVSAPFTIVGATNCPAADPTDSNADDAALQACLDLGGLIKLDPNGPGVGYIIAQGLRITRNNTTILSGNPPARAKLVAAPPLTQHVIRYAYPSISSLTITFLDLDGNRYARTDPITACPAVPSGSAGGSNLAAERAGPITLAELNGFTFTDSRSTRALCGNALELYGSFLEVARNIIDDNDGDGITLARCVNGNIYDNQIAEFTDIGIVSGGGQNCRIENNTLSNTTHYAFAGIALHVFCFPGTCGDHTGSVVSGNQVSAAANRLGFGISLGLHPWGFPPDTRTKGGSVTNNSVSGAIVNLAIDGVGCTAPAEGCPSESFPGMVVTGNTLGSAQGTSRCGSPTPEVYAVNPDHVENSTLQPGWVVRSYDNCFP